MSESQFKPEETFYDILKLDRGATTTEIVAAYHAAKAAFSKDSIATYSLFSNEETQEILQKLEEAYMTLSNLEKKRQYDRWLDGDVPAPKLTVTAVQPPKENANMNEATSPPPESNAANSETPSSQASVPTSPPATPAAAQPAIVSGDYLRELREKRGLSVDDVCRITKIPSKFLKAIEGHDFKNLPARVYIQGFIKNLSSLYRLEPQITAKSYLDYIDQLSSAKQN
jgi:hypothetical protein